MLNKISRLFNTIKHLKLKQIIYQLWYRIITAKKLAAYNAAFSIDKVAILKFDSLPPIGPLLNIDKNWFTFLNICEEFEEKIDWNIQKHGKLWNYNLQYCNFLLKKNISRERRIKLLLSLYRTLSNGDMALEPYPVSLRSINVIRFFSEESIFDVNLLASLHAELDFLSHRLEFHLLGNHLLENLFGLMMGGAFFSETKWVKIAEKLLRKQLREQIQNDGAHFELSPMYHQIILFRLLELIDWYSKWKYKNKEFERYLIGIAERMCAWLDNITFENGTVPNFNDSAIGIAYSTEWLIRYASGLKISLSKIPLGESGYRSISRSGYECKVDVAQLGASYQPGHAHADALSFILNYNNRPLFVEVGTSTYQNGNVRDGERSTSAHNTVVVNNKNQSNVWGGFRVAERANIRIIEESDLHLFAEHDGYKKLNIIHRRDFIFKNKEISIIDKLSGNKNLKKYFSLHFYAGLEVLVIKDTVKVINIVDIIFIGAITIEIENYNMATGFNKYQNGKKIVVYFEEELNTQINFK